MENDPTKNPPKEITRVFKTHTGPDGAQTLDEQPPITDAPAPADETIDSSVSRDPVPVKKSTKSKAK